jgi:hypothetical protein
MENLTLKGCTDTHQILSNSFNQIKMLSISVDEAGDDHPLAQFSGDPVGCVGKDEDAWEKFNRLLDTVLQKHPEELHKLDGDACNCGSNAHLPNADAEVHILSCSGIIVSCSTWEKHKTL